MSQFKEKIRGGEPVIGTMVTTFMNPDVITMLKICGLDYVIVDCEHGSLDYSEVAGLLGRGRAIDFPVLVRIPEVKREVVLKYMEAGAYGLLLPNTETVAHAKALVEFSKYAPLGNRGVSLLRPHSRFEKISDVSAYMNRTNDETVLMIQVESPTCVENLDDILSVEGIDCAFVGPNDLSQSLGVMGQYQSRPFVEAIDKVVAIAKKHGKACGIHLTGAPEELAAYSAMGMKMNLWSNDVIMMMTEARAGMAKLK